MRENGKRKMESGEWRVENGQPPIFHLPLSPFHFPSLSALVLLIVCLLLTIFAQRSLDRREDMALALGAYGLAALTFGLLVHRVELERKQKAAPVERRPWRPLPLLGGMVLGLLSFPYFADNRFTLLGTLLWLGGLGLFFWALRDDAPHAEGLRAWLGRCLASRGITLPWEWIAVLGIMAIGAFYRLYQLDLIPAEMGCDLPHIYNNARHILRGEYLIFFPSYPGREGLFFYLTALYSAIFGLSYFSIKLTSALIGVVTIPVLYLLARELFNREVALYTAVFLAISKWHIILSRTGLRGVLIPLFVGLVGIFLIRAMATRRRLYFGLTGLFLGLGWYTYSAFLVAPVAIVLFLAVYSLVDRGKFVRENVVELLLLFVMALLVYIPLARYAYENPQTYWFRVATRVTSQEVALPQNLSLVFLDNLRKSFLMFNHTGDGVSINNVPFQRQLGFVSGILFVLGLAYCLIRWRRGYNALLIVLLAVMILPTALSVAFPNEVPGAIRSSGTIVPAFILVALPLPLVRRCLQRALPQLEAQQVFASLAISPGQRWEVRWRVPSGIRHLVMGLFVLALLWEGREAYQIYFRDYVAHLPDHNYSISLEMARAIDNFAADGPAYIKVWPFWHDGNAVRAQLRVQSQDWNGEIAQLDPNAPPLATLREKAMFILHPEDREALNTLRRFFPRGVAVEHYDQGNRMTFITFYGERYPEP